MYISQIIRKKETSKKKGGGRDLKGKGWWEG